MKDVKLAYPIETPEAFCPLMGMRGDFAENAAILEGLGYQYVELLVRDAEELERTDYADILRRRHLQPVAITSASILKQDGLSLLNADAERARRAEERLLRMLPLAARWGVPLCIGGNRGAVSAEPGCTMDDLARIIARLGKAAEDAGATLAIEPQAAECINNLNSIDETLAFIRTLGVKSVKLHLDTCHMAPAEADMGEAILRAGEDVAFVHISDTDRLIPGDGSIDFRAVIAAFRRAGYTGGLSAEVEQTPDSRTVAARYIDVMRRLL